MQQSPREFQAAQDEQNATPKASATRRASQKAELAQQGMTLLVEDLAGTDNSNNDRATTPKPDTPPSNDESRSDAGSPLTEDESQDSLLQPLKATGYVKPNFKNKPQYIEITPLDLENITSERIINLYLAISGARKSGFITRANLHVCNTSELEQARIHGDYLRLPYNLTHQILSKQYRDGIKALLARVKFGNDPKAKAILQEIIGGIQHRYELKLKLIESYPAEKLLQINLNALHTEIMPLISEVESNPLTMYFEEVECKIHFKKSCLELLINRIRHLANEVPALAEKLNTFFASIRIEHIEKILNWDKKHFQEYADFWTISAACHQLPKILHSNDSIVNLAISHYVQNSAACKFSPLLRASFALIAINTLSDNLPLKIAAEIKDQFEVHAKKLFNSDNVEALLNSLKAMLTRVLDKEVPSSTIRLFSPSKKINQVLVEQLHTMLKWIKETDLALEHDELDETFDNFVLLSPQAPDTKTQKSTPSRTSLNNSNANRGMIPVTPAKAAEAIAQAESEESSSSLSDDDDSKGKAEYKAKDEHTLQHVPSDDSLDDDSDSEHKRDNARADFW